jgi:hypothetical protein
LDQLTLTIAAVIVRKGIIARIDQFIFSHLPLETMVESVISALIRRKSPVPYKTKTSKVAALLFVKL